MENQGSPQEDTNLTGITRMCAGSVLIVGPACQSAEEAYVWAKDIDARCGAGERVAHVLPALPLDLYATSWPAQDDEGKETDKTEEIDSESSAADEPEDIACTLLPLSEGDTVTIDEVWSFAGIYHSPKGGYPLIWAQISFDRDLTPGSEAAE